MNLLTFDEFSFNTVKILMSTINNTVLTAPLNMQ